ncbi:hypothetical protein [Chryseobacterium sp. CCH4-E10]|uniref:hypothetical protein n=1 Tax=Chryseobacterium sp. CCH4-E10 TaxID=1768758 RepID=UPI000829994B|nr:hypothetical protein [Chryseobacterium sp. CCH4-E10]
MKKNIIPFLALTAFFVISCNRDEITSNNNDEAVNTSSLYQRPPDTAVITPFEKNVQGVFFTNGVECQELGRPPAYGYKYYVASDITESYDRVVESRAIQGTLFLPIPTLTIPAGSYVSNTINIFNNISYKIGNITSSITSVKINGAEINDYKKISYKTNINNCFTLTHPGNGGVDCYDENGDYIDANEDGYPDCYESN